MGAGCPSKEESELFQRVPIQDPRNGRVVEIPSIPVESLSFGNMTLQQMIFSLNHHNRAYYASEEAYNEAMKPILGKGISGVVRTAKWNNQPVAVKFLYSDEYFLKEASAHARLKHPAMVELHGTCNFTAFSAKALVMEYLPLGNLEEYLKQRDKHNNITLNAVINDYSMLIHKKIEDGSDWPLMFRFATDISAAMAYVHRQGFLHRDLKPSNILIASTNIAAPVTAKICDFGTGRETDTMMTQKAIGTYSYMAPEMLSALPYSNKIDVWSFGVILWEIVSREVAFKGKPLMYIIEYLITKRNRLPIPSYTPTCIATLIQKCWDEDSEERYSFDTIHQKLNEMKNDWTKIFLEAMTLQMRGIDKIKSGQLYESRTVSVIASAAVQLQCARISSQMADLGVSNSIKQSTEISTSSFEDDNPTEKYDGDDELGDDVDTDNEDDEDDVYDESEDEEQYKEEDSNEFAQMRERAWSKADMTPVSKDTKNILISKYTKAIGEEEKPRAASNSDLLRRQRNVRDHRIRTGSLPATIGSSPTQKMILSAELGLQVKKPRSGSVEERERERPTRSPNPSSKLRPQLAGELHLNGQTVVQVRKYGEST